MPDNQTTERDRYPELRPVTGEHIACLHQAILDDRERADLASGYYQWRAQRLAELAAWLEERSNDRA